MKYWVGEIDADGWGADGLFYGETQVGDGITVKRGRCGGLACIKGTRIAVWHVELGRRSGLGAKKLANSTYQNISVEQIQNAFHYATTFPDEIDNDIRENEEPE